MPFRAEGSVLINPNHTLQPPIEERLLFDQVPLFQPTNEAGAGKDAESGLTGDLGGMYIFGFREKAVTGAL